MSIAASIETIRKYFALATLCESERKSSLDNKDSSFNFSDALKISDDNFVILSLSNLNTESLPSINIPEIIEIVIFHHAQGLKIASNLFISAEQ
jgi:hypothetical protein